MKKTASLPPPTGVIQGTSVPVGPPTQAVGGTFPRRHPDLTGSRFGRWTVLSQAGNNRHGQRCWNVKCDCGTKRVLPTCHLRTGSSLSCGCYRRTKTSEIRLIDLVGLRFGRLIVLSRAEDRRAGNPRWHVKCDCGNTRIVLGANLRKGNTTSCGCYKLDQTSRRCLIDLTGRQFGRLVVLSRATNNRYKGARWKTQCDCGKTAIVSGSDLRSGHTTSCGCLHRERLASCCGAAHPSWNPKLTAEDRQRRRFGTRAQATFATIARRIRRRDRAICLTCGGRGLQVHHLEPWVLDRDLRYEPANLVVLCKECHDQFHQLYGNDAGLEDFEEYQKP